MSTQMCVDLCYRALSEQNNAPSLVRAKCFHTLDAFVRLIALLVKHSGTTCSKIYARTVFYGKLLNNKYYKRSIDLNIISLFQCLLYITSLPILVNQWIFHIRWPTEHHHQGEPPQQGTRHRGRSLANRPRGSEEGVPAGSLSQVRRMSEFPLCIYEIVHYMIIVSIALC